MVFTRGYFALASKQVGSRCSATRACFYDSEATRLLYFAFGLSSTLIASASSASDNFTP
jgi:hypothetical protein